MGLARPTLHGFSLVVGFRNRLDRRALLQWKTWIRHGARLLQEATGGQLRVDTVYLAIGSHAVHEADLVVAPGSSNATSPVHAAGSPGMFQLHHEDDLETPLVLVHEFGHYGLGLQDEQPCLGDPRFGACIMEFSQHGDRLSFRNRRTRLRRGPVWAFCNPCNHRAGEAATAPTPSCWEIIARVVPGVSGPPGPRRRMPLPKLTFVDLCPQQRVALVLASRTQAARRAFTAARRFWEAGTIGMQVSLIEVEADAEGEAVDFVGTLRRALDGLRGGGPSASRVIVCLADGVLHDPTRLQALVPDLQRERVRVFCASTRQDADHAALLDLTSRSAGRLERCDTAADAWTRARDFAVECHAEIVDGVGMVAMTEFGANEQSPVARFWIEDGSRRAVVVVAGPNAGASAAGRIVFPGEPSSGLDQGGAVLADLGLTVFLVDDPPPGCWEVRLDGITAHHTLLAFSTNPEVHMGCHGMWSPVLATEATKLVARAVDFHALATDASGGTNGNALGGSSTAHPGEQTSSADGAATAGAAPGQPEADIRLSPVVLQGVEVLMAPLGTYNRPWSRQQPGAHGVAICLDELWKRRFRRIRRFQVHVV